MLSPDCTVYCFAEAGVEVRGITRDAVFVARAGDVVAVAVVRVPTEREDGAGRFTLVGMERPAVAGVAIALGPVADGEVGRA
ncbi:hypothetical protein [Poriferisphaera corsica]|uniref:hypothetical protein n=1 Tax=Poriferisphaera corsica TaxID=2528020 RepID=UPI0019099A69|nr:hypothetical protein [Poriferisphaera corsica]